MNAVIPLLSLRPFLSFSPEEFRAHVESLYVDPEIAKEKKRARMKKPQAKPFTWRRNKKGTFILRVNRKPKWITPEEFDFLSIEALLPANELFLYLKEKEIKISTQVVQDAIAQQVEEIPWK